MPLIWLICRVRSGDVARNGLVARLIGLLWHQYTNADLPQQQDLPLVAGERASGCAAGAGRRGRPAPAYVVTCFGVALLSAGATGTPVLCLPPVRAGPTLPRGAASAPPRAPRAVHGKDH